MVHYVHKGSRRKYTPDFLVRLANEVEERVPTPLRKAFVVRDDQRGKGEPGEVPKAKTAAMQQWTKAVNHHGGFGTWRFVEVRNPAEMADVVASLM